MSVRLSQAITDAAAEVCAGLGPLISGQVPLPLDNSQAFDATLARITAVQDACLAQLVQTGLWGRDNQTPSQDFWNLAGRVIGYGPMQRHAREKPLGYAGDYRLLDQIADNRIASEVLTGAFDRYFQNQAAPKAVRNRAAEIADRIVSVVRENPNRRAKICSVGSGSAPDVRRALQELSSDEIDRLDVSLLDLDPNALAFAASRLGCLPTESLHTHRVNLFRIARQSALAELLSNSDLVFCSGLFDYLKHDDAVSLLKTVWSQLRIGGRLLAFNFSKENPSRAYMEWFGNWYLEYREPDDMQSLGRDAGWSHADFNVKIEQENVNLFIDARKS